MESKTMTVVAGISAIMAVIAAGAAVQACNSAAKANDISAKVAKADSAARARQEILRIAGLFTQFELERSRLARDVKRDCKLLTILGTPKPDKCVDALDDDDRSRWAAGFLGLASQVARQLSDSPDNGRLKLWLAQLVATIKASPQLCHIAKQGSLSQIPVHGELARRLPKECGTSVMSMPASAPGIGPIGGRTFLLDDASSKLKAKWQLMDNRPTDIVPLQQKSP